MREKQQALNIQKINRTAVYQLLRRGAGLTKQEIVRQSGLSLPTVMNNIAALQSEGLIQEEGVVSHTGGRRAKTWNIVKDAHIAIGIDVTRDYFLAAAVDLTGEIVYKTRTDRKFERCDAWYKRLGEVVEKVAQNACPDSSRILGVGIGVPALLTKDRETVFYGEILKCTGVTRGEFSRYIPFKTALLNDADAAGFGEFWTRENLGSAFYLSMSNSIGGAIMIENHILTGNHYHSGEVGHLTLHPGGKVCYCGQRGCVDSYLAVKALTDLTGGDLPSFFRLLESGDKRALAVWDAYLDDFALTVNNLQEVLDCTVILGGYIAEYIDPYLPELRRRVAALNPFEKAADYITICRYKTWSIAAGAALTYISGFIDSV